MFEGRPVCEKFAPPNLRAPRGKSPPRAPPDLEASACSKRSSVVQTSPLLPATSRAPSAHDMNSPPLLDCAEEPQPRLFHDIASYVIVFTHSCFGRVTFLPFPVGTVVKNVEQLVDPWVHPFVEAWEESSLGILAAVDDQMYVLGTFVEGCILGTFAKVRRAPIILHKRGLAGVSADLWVRYEAALRETIQKAIDFANRFPLLNLVTPVLCAISAPLATSVSDWLVKHSEVEEKGIQPSFYIDLWKEQDFGEPEGKPIELQPLKETQDLTEEKPKQTQDLTDEKPIAVSAEGIEEVKGGEGEKVGKVDETVAEEKIGKVDETGVPHEQKDVTEILEMIDSGWLSGAPTRSPLKTSEEGIEEVQEDEDDKAGEVDETVGEDKLGTIDVNGAPHEDKDVTEVLEMIDSGWLLGSPSRSPPKTFSSPRNSKVIKSRKGSRSRKSS